jgi:hypothetical protein
MPKRTDREQVAIAFAIYTIAGVCLFNIHPVNPWLVGLRLGLLTLISGVCVYAVAVLLLGFTSSRTVCVQSFSPLTNRIIGGVASLTCSFMVAYPLYSGLAVSADHHSMNGWRKFANFQAKVIEFVEGRHKAEQFWNKCADHLANQAISFERKQDYERALDYFTEYKKFGDESTFMHLDSDGVLGRVYDEMKDYKKADEHYAFVGAGIDENSTTKTYVCHGKLIRIFQFVPDEILIAEFPWGQHLAEFKDNSALALGQTYEEIDFSQLDDYQRQLLRPAFHPEMLGTYNIEGYPRERLIRWTPISAAPVAGNLVRALTDSHAPTVEELR